MTTQYQLSRYVVLTDLIDENESSDPSRLLYSTRTGKTITIKDRILQAISRGDFSQLTNQHLISLIHAEVIVRKDEDEFAEVLRRNVLAVEDSRSLDVTIMPTANCQLGCNYCGQVHSKKNVDAEMSDKMFNRIVSNLKNGAYESLGVKWFGAEPLMAYSEILTMSDRLIEHCDSHKIKYSAGMITNGLSFKPAVFEKLAERRVKSFQITLDGIGATHDLQRMTKEGKKTFDIIFQNIVNVASLPEFVERKCTIGIRVNVTSTSAKTIYKLIDRLAHFGVQERGVLIQFSPVFDWGGNGADQTGLSKADFAAAEIEWMLYAMKKGFRQPNVLPRRSTSPCMVVKRDSEVYDVKGNVFPCYEFPYTPTYEGPEYRIGHLDTIDTERNLNAVTKNWFEDIKGEVAPCKSCNLFPVCGGACPKQWYSGQVACPPFKANIQDRIVMNYLIKKDAGFGERLKSMAFE
ncbi:SPASM domain-containing protein [Massilia pinisoli]|uniref:SPASM domain-containing protein n=1 Tax=Massilia pinisoli TaxID=1772194 RepID=A0ABT1ZUN0_9BURK|nr:radical SAM protein [Massilia pinisoli]MCS0583574.1 SPASM domain-containing protein [Massilia pinisoli]